MFHALRSRIHESFALAAIFSAAVALHVAWIDHLLVTRSATFKDWITINPAIGPISGLYLDVAGAFFVTLLITAAVWRGKDVRHWQERVFWFFVMSLGVFLVMTLPFVYGFVVV